MAASSVDDQLYQLELSRIQMLPLTLNTVVIFQQDAFVSQGHCKIN